jgi:hypothetical protein
MASTDITTTGNRIVLDYTSRDYKAIRSMLVGLAKGILPDWQTVGDTGDFGTLLLELYAYANDVTNYYIDRMASEAFLGTAVRRQSVMYIADMLGYRPIGQRSAVTSLSFTWKWDENTLNENAVSYYDIESAEVSNSLVTMVLSNGNGDFRVNIYPGQTITVTGLGNPYDGQFVVVTTKESVDSNNLTIAYDVVSSASGEAVIPETGSQVTVGSVVIIPTGTIVSTNPDQDGNVVQFEIGSNVVLDTLEGTPVSEGSSIRSVSKLVTASEGVTVSAIKIGTSKGIPNAEFIIDQSGIVDRTVKVFTKEGGQVVEWSRIDKISLASPTQSVYTTFVDDKNYTHIMFGDNASGRVPPTNVEIYASYRYGVGAAANSVGTGKVTVIGNDFATQSGVTVTNTTKPVGGADVESVEAMRYSIPRATATKQRAVTIDDYVALALQVSGITKATAYGENYTSVYVRIASTAESTGYVTSVVTAEHIYNGVATIAIADSLNLTVGQTIYNTNIDADVNGSVRVSRVFSPLSTMSITSASLTDDVATITISSVSGFGVGQPVVVAGLTGDFAVLNGVHVLTDVNPVGVTGDCDLLFNKVNTDITESTGSEVTSGTVKVSAGFSFETDAANTGSPVVEAVQFVEADGATVTTVASDMQLLINSLESYLSDKKLIGSVVYGEPVEWTDIDVDIDVVVRPLYNRESVRAAVQAAIENLLSYDNVSFGQRISIGDVYRRALGVDGVDYVTLNTLEIAGAAETSPVDINTPTYNIPRLNPDLQGTDTWVNASGGLVNT